MGASADERLDRAVAALRSEAVGFLADLVAVDTSNPPGRNYGECVALLAGRLEAWGLRCERFPVATTSAAGPVEVLRARTGDGPDRLYLHGHYDVVPAPPAQFVPRQRGDELWGRGAADMKGGIVAMALAAAAVRRAAPDAGCVTLLLVPDEETGGRIGAEQLAELGLIDRQARGALLAEPTSGVVWRGHRGALTLWVEVAGRTAHIGLAHEGLNAVEAALPLLEASRRVGAELAGEELAPGRARDPDSRGRAPASAYVVGGRVEGASVANAVPERFAFSIDARLAPELSVDDLEANLRAALAEAATGASHSVTVLQRAPASQCDPGGSLPRLLAGAVAEIRGAPPRFEVCPGVLESRVYLRCGIDALTFGPGELELAHGPEERVSLEAVVQCARIYGRTVLRALEG